MQSSFNNLVVMKVILLLLPIVITLTCCKHDSAEFRMQYDHFINTEIQHLSYQNYLDSMISLSTDPALKNLAALRKDQSARIMLELSDFVHEPISLKNEDLEKTEKIKAISKAQLPKQLLFQVVLADQEWLGLHVKASISTGLVDEKLRIWAEGKSRILRDRLEASQHAWMIR